MASIQSAVGGLTASIMGATLGASHLYQQTDLYKAQSAGRRVNKLNKAFAEEVPGADLSQASREQLHGLQARGEVATNLRREAFELAPSAERARAYQKALDEKERLGSLIEERIGELDQQEAEARETEEAKFRAEAEEELRQQFETERRAEEEQAYLNGQDPEIQIWDTTPSPEVQKLENTLQRGRDIIRATITNQEILKMSAQQTAEWEKQIRLLNENPEMVERIRQRERGGNK